MSDDKIIIFEDWKRERTAVQEPFRSALAEPKHSMFVVMDSAAEQLGAIGMSTEQIARLLHFYAREILREQSTS